MAAVDPNNYRKRQPLKVDRRIAAVAGRQYGVVTGAQLRALGLDRAHVDYRVKVGRLAPVHRGVYAVGHSTLPVEGRFMAAVLAVGDAAVLSHFSAAALWGLWRRPHPRERIDVSAARAIRNRAGICAHRSRLLPAGDTTCHEGIPVTTTARTLLDLAGVMTSDRALRRMVNEAQVQRLITSQQLEARVARAAAQRRGVRRLACLLADGPARTRSELEDRTLELLRRHRFPAPQVNATVATPEGLFEVDFLYRSLKLVIEADGHRYHSTRQARVADADRQAALEAAGYRVLRLTWQQVTAQPERTVARLVAARLRRDEAQR